MPKLKDSVAPADKNDILELDELWSFVRIKTNKQWLWIALCKRTRQVVAFILGGRGEKSCCKLWNKIPIGYQKYHTYYGDF